MRLQQSDPIFNMWVDIMRPALNLGPECRVTMLTRVDWNKGNGASPAFKGLVCFKVGCRVREGTGAGLYGKSVRKITAFP